MSFRNATRWGLSLVVLFAASGVHGDVDPRSYYPLAVGHFWTYSISSQGTSARGTTTVVSSFEDAGTTLYVLRSTTADGTTEEWLSNDEDGLRLHRTEASALGIVAELWFEPPVVVVAPDASVGTATPGQGTATLVIPRVGAFPLSYLTTSRVLAEEPVNVPAGTFLAAKAELSLSVSGVISIPGQGSFPVSFTGLDTNWLVDHIGLVSSTEHLDGQLIATVALTDMRAPLVSLTAEPPTIARGQASTLAWVSQLAEVCVAEGGWVGDRDPNGSEVVFPEADTVYDLTCEGPGGFATDRATLSVPEPKALGSAVTALLTVALLARPRSGSRSRRGSGAGGTEAPRSGAR